jgi:predicted flap endonuclease-1-like 5' DNA nuclease
MGIQATLSALDEMVEKGLWLEAAEMYYAENIRSHSKLTGLANGKMEKQGRVSAFLGKVGKINRVQVTSSAVLDDSHSISEVQYDVTMKDGTQAVWCEQVKRTWQNGFIIEEKYFSDDNVSGQAPMNIHYADVAVSREVALKREIPLVKEVIVETPVEKEVFTNREVALVKEVILEKEVPVLRHIVNEVMVPVDITLRKEHAKINIVEEEKEIRFEVVREVPKLVQTEILVEVESPVIREVEIKRPVVTEVAVDKEVIHRVEVIKEIPVYQEVIIEREVPVIVEVYVDKEVIHEVVVEREVPVEREVIIEREIPVIKEVFVDKIVEVIVEVIVERVVEREVILEVEVPVVKHVYVDKPVEREVIIEREVAVIKEVIVEKPVLHEVTIVKEVPSERTLTLQRDVPEFVHNEVEISRPVIQETVKQISVNVPVVRTEIVENHVDIVLQHQKPVFNTRIEEVEIIHELVEQHAVPKTVIVQKAVQVIEEQIVELNIPVVHQKSVEKEVEVTVSLVNEISKVIENVQDLEVITEVAIMREVPVEREVTLNREVLSNVREVFTDVAVDREITVMREIPVIREVITEVEVPVVREVIVEKQVPVLREKIVERIVEHEVIVEKEVHVTKEIIVEKPVIREVIIEREVPVIVEKFVDKAVQREVTIERNSQTRRQSMSAEEIQKAGFSEQYTTRQAVEKEIVSRERGIDPELELLRRGDLVEMDAAALRVEEDVPDGMLIESVHTMPIPEATSTTETFETVTYAETVSDGSAYETKVIEPAEEITMAQTAEVGAASTDQVAAENLQIIEGIGPKIEELLNSAGIYTFRQVANTSSDDLREILSQAGPRFTMHDPATWPAQALLAARGNWDELKSWQQEMKGGRG